MDTHAVLMIPRSDVDGLEWPERCAVCGSEQVAARVALRASVTPLFPRGEEFTARYEVAVPVCAAHERAVRDGRRRARLLVLLATVAGGVAGLILGALVTGVPVVAGALALAGLLTAQVLTARATAPPVDVYAYRDRLELHILSADVARELAESNAADLVERTGS
jgi:hypothetical protein